jgi:hypothetical protein
MTGKQVAPKPSKLLTKRHETDTGCIRHCHCVSITHRLRKQLAPAPGRSVGAKPDTKPRSDVSKRLDAQIVTARQTVLLNGLLATATMADHQAHVLISPLQTNLFVTMF